MFLNKILLSKLLYFQEEFSQKNREMLFGKDCNAEKAFDHLDEDKDGEVGLILKYVSQKCN